MPRFAQVILPLPVYGSFTYEIPDELRDSLSVGARVLVPFGARKLYTGIVESFSDRTDADYELKQIASLLDPDPIVRYPQLKFWNWIAEYYLCTPGEVMKAALPAALKIESETVVELNKAYEEIFFPESSGQNGESSGQNGGIISETVCSEGGDGPVCSGGEGGRHPLTESEAAVIQLLDHNGKMRIGDLEGFKEIRNPHKTIQSLLDSGRILISERLTDKYISRKITCVGLNVRRGDDDRLHALFGLTSRSRKQEQLLVAYLEMSRWMQARAPLCTVEKKELLLRAGVSPAVFKAMADKGIFTLTVKNVNRFAGVNDSAESTLPVLSGLQQKAAERIVALWKEKTTVLLQGVTGSGKTEVYSHLMQRALDAGRQVLFLVPEISLTTQLTKRLRDIFGNKLLVYHSKFSDSERADIWRRLLTSREPLVVVGARSAVFLPFASLGMVIVDEEHEASYKQQEPAPRYNGRDCAIMLATMHGSKVLLGSATPSVETYFKATNGLYGLAELTERYHGTELPDVEVVDMRLKRRKKETDGIYSLDLVARLRHTVADGKQAIVFQNRRGFAPVVVCSQCGWTPKCVNCDVSLVYHKRTNELRCHYCGYITRLPNVCPACGMNSVETHGYGTERVADKLHAILPEARLVRMDLDTTRNKDSYSEIIDEFSRKETDILIGTQMVTKGLDFENVSTVGIVNADTLLNFPDFRSDERAFNMLEQVSGRAGRKDTKGKVIVQTTDPDNPVIGFVKRHDYAGFYSNELENRRRYSYPPFTRVINIYLRNKDQRTVIQHAAEYTEALQAVFGNRVLGPETPYVGRVSTWYIRSVMLKVEAGASMKKVKELLRDIYVRLATLPGMKSTRIHYDVDPV